MGSLKLNSSWILVIYNCAFVGDFLSIFCGHGLLLLFYSSTLLRLGVWILFLDLCDQKCQSFDGLMPSLTPPCILFPCQGLIMHLFVDIVCLKCNFKYEIWKIYYLVLYSFCKSLFILSLQVKDTVEVDHNVSRHLDAQLSLDDWNLMVRNDIIVWTVCNRSMFIVDVP